MRKKDVKGKKRLFCIKCNCQCEETVFVHRTVSKFYFYCEGCSHLEVKAVRMNTKEFLAAQNQTPAPPKKKIVQKAKVRTTKSRCGVCGVTCTGTIYARDWGGGTYYYCHGCRHKDSKAQERVIRPKCESCGTPIKQYKLCLNCYKKDKAIQRELDAGLDRNLSED